MRQAACSAACLDWNNHLIAVYESFCCALVVQRVQAAYRPRLVPARG